MKLINCEISLILTWSERYFIIDAPFAGQEATFRITDTKLYLLVVTLSTQDNAKMLEQLKSGFNPKTPWEVNLTYPLRFFEKCIF